MPLIGSLRIENRRGHGIGNIERTAILDGVPWIAPHARANGERNLRREKILRAKMHFGHVVRLVRLVDCPDVRIDRHEVVDQVRIRDVHRVRVDDEHGNWTDRDADAVDI